MTSIIDIYKAAGGEVSEDGTMVSISKHPHPFEITLTVVPHTISTGYDRPEEITFAVLLDPARLITEHAFGATVSELEYSENVTLPVDQVRIVEKEQTDDNH